MEKDPKPGTNTPEYVVLEKRKKRRVISYEVAPALAEPPTLSRMIRKLALTCSFHLLSRNPHTSRNASFTPRRCHPGKCNGFMHMIPKKITAGPLTIFVRGFPYIEPLSQPLFQISNPPQPHRPPTATASSNRFQKPSIRIHTYALRRLKSKSINPLPKPLVRVYCLISQLRPPAHQVVAITTIADLLPTLIHVVHSDPPWP